MAFDFNSCEMDWNNTTDFERCFIAAVQGRRIWGWDLQVNKFEPGPQWSHGAPIENRQTDRHTHTHTTENIMFPQLRGKNINLVLKVRTNVDI